MVQIILLIIILGLKQNHIYWIGIDKTHSIYAKSSNSITADSNYLAADNQLQIAVFTFIGFLVFEFLMLLGGVSIMFGSLIYLQNFIHFLGCMFSVWFLLDSW